MASRAVARFPDCLQDRGPRTLLSWGSDMTVKKGSALAFGVLLAALALSSTIAGCRTQEHFFDVTDDLFVVSAADYYPQALDKARQWRPDAHLDLISTSPAPSALTMDLPYLCYFFDSRAAETTFYEVCLRQGTWRGEAVSEAGSSVTYPPIKREDWALDSVDAWAIAEANGGEDFLLKHQDPLTMMAITLSHERIGDREDVLVWRVWYRVGSATVYSALDMMIDPKTGDILRLETD